MSANKTALTRDKIADTLNRVYLWMVNSTYTIAEIEAELVRALVKMGVSRTRAQRIVAEYLDS